MRVSITIKIILSYIVVILASLSIIAAVTSYEVNLFLENSAKSSLLSDAVVIENISKTNTFSESQLAQRNVQKLIRDRIRHVGGLQCTYAIVTKTYAMVYPNSGVKATYFRDTVLPKIQEQFGNVLTKSTTQGDSIEFVIKKVKYFAIAKQINAIASPYINDGWVILYTKAENIQLFGGNILFALLISFVFIGIGAVIFGIFFARSIALPIIILKKRAESLSKRDFDTSVEIKTGDELEDLADSINKMAAELKAYDTSQKKFFQNASHELKTPLMSIQGYAEGIKDGVFDNNDHALEVISEESTRLKDIVEKLIYMSKLESMGDFYKYSKESINEIVKASIDKVNSLALKKEVKLICVTDGDVSLVVDRDKILQALINILGNCIRYAKSEVVVVTSNDGKCFTITINDDGNGFDVNEVKFIFERFYKGKSGSTGLGLSITKVIIEKHKGSITAINGKNGGAEFIIKLPI